MIHSALQTIWIVGLLGFVFIVVPGIFIVVGDGFGKFVDRLLEKRLSWYRPSQRR